MEGLLASLQGAVGQGVLWGIMVLRSEEHTSELQSLYS